MLSILATPLVMASAILFSAGFICAGLRMLKS
jgi:hypothetical protein